MYKVAYLYNEKWTVTTFDNQVLAMEYYWSLQLIGLEPTIHYEPTIEEKIQEIENNSYATKPNN